jgi:hypothetical protein
MQVPLAKPRLQRRKVAGLWTLVATLILLASAQPTAYGLDFPETFQKVHRSTHNLILPNHSSPPRWRSLHQFLARWN